MYKKQKIFQISERMERFWNHEKNLNMRMNDGKGNRELLRTSMFLRRLLATINRFWLQKSLCVNLHFRDISTGNKRLLKFEALTILPMEVVPC